MPLIDSLPPFLFPTRARGTRWLREQLRALGVSAPLSPACLDEWVASAAAAARAAYSSNENYAATLRKQLEARAHFVHRWTTSDEALSDPKLSDWIAMARKHLLPRAWTITPATVTESQRDRSFAVPERLIVKKQPRNLNLMRPDHSVVELPGEQILTDLKRAADK